MIEYNVGVLQDFVSLHYLVGGDFGPEGLLHSHHYRAELTVTGTDLDRHGFLVDIVRLRSELERLVDGFRDRTLNDLPAFAGLNPGVEVVARVLGEALGQAFAKDGLSSLTLKLWEHDAAWASFRMEPGR